MKEVVFSDPSKGYEIEVSYKDGSKSSKFFTAHQFAKANNYFNKMNKSMDKNVHTVKTKDFTSYLLGVYHGWYAFITSVLDYK